MDTTTELYIEPSANRAAAVGAIVLHLDPGHGYDLLGAQLHLTLQDLRAKYR